jgi:hypothetical protein
VSGRAALVVVVHGTAYERYAAELIDSARAFFRPTDTVDFHVFPARPGWPDATLYRYHAILDRQEVLDHDFVFLTDADMRFEAEVGPEILSPLTATHHPGYVRVARSELPYERRPVSSASVPAHRGAAYYAGGFVGGRRDSFLDLAQTIASSIDRDDAAGLVACWHDESHLNRVLAEAPPFRELSPAYCYPDDDSRYLEFWRDCYPRRLVALDKAMAR